MSSSGLRSTSPETAGFGPDRRTVRVTDRSGIAAAAQPSFIGLSGSGRLDPYPRGCGSTTFERGAVHLVCASAASTTWSPSPLGRTSCAATPSPPGTQRGPTVREATSTPRPTPSSTAAREGVAPATERIKRQGVPLEGITSATHLPGRPAGHPWSRTGLYGSLTPCAGSVRARTGRVGYCQAPASGSVVSASTPSVKWWKSTRDSSANAVIAGSETNSPMTSTRTVTS